MGTLTRNICFFLILGFFWTSDLCAQASASASFTASATIIQPIGITTTSNMNFARLDAKNGGSVTLTPGNERFKSGDVDLAEGGTVSAAAFELTGQRGFSFNISLPKVHFLLSNGQETMVLRDFTSSLGDGGNFSDGSQSLNIGATLDIKPQQQHGYYTTQSPIVVTVNYN